MAIVGQPPGRYARASQSSPRPRARSADARACPRSRPDRHPNCAPDHGTSEAASRRRCRPCGPRPAPRAERRNDRRPSACTRDCPRTTPARRSGHRVARDRLRSRARRFRAVRSSTPRTRDTPGRAFRVTGITVRARRRPSEPRRRLRGWDDKFERAGASRLREPHGHSRASAGPANPPCVHAKKAEAIAANVLRESSVWLYCGSSPACGAGASGAGIAAVAAAAEEDSCRIDGSASR